MITEIPTKKSALDLTDLALTVVVLGVAVTIGATIIISMRDSKLTDLSVLTKGNETIATRPSNLANKWFKGVVTVTNATGGHIINPGNYSVTTSSIDGTATITNLTNSFPSSWNVTYQYYDTSRADYDLANDAATGISEYGNWFKILVIVGVASVVLALIFMAFGKGSNVTSY